MDFKTAYSEYQKTGGMYSLINSHTNIMVKSSPTTVAIYLFDKDDEIVNECSFDPNSEFVKDTLGQYLEPIHFIGESKNNVIDSLSKWAKFVCSPHKKIDGGFYSIDDIMADRNS